MSIFIMSDNLNSNFTSKKLQVGGGGGGEEKEPTKLHKNQV